MFLIALVPTGCLMGNGLPGSPEGTPASSDASTVDSSSNPSLAITPGSTAYAVHRVAEGDTLYSIARRYGITVPALVSLNPSVSPRSLPVGHALRVPAEKPAVRAIRRVTPEDPR